MPCPISDLQTKTVIWLSGVIVNQALGRKISEEVTTSPMAKHLSPAGVLATARVRPAPPKNCRRVIVSLMSSHLPASENGWLERHFMRESVSCQDGCIGRSSGPHFAPLDSVADSPLYSLS